MHSRQITIHSDQTLTHQGKEINFYDVTSIVLDGDRIISMTIQKPAPPKGTLFWGWDMAKYKKLSDITDYAHVLIDESMGEFECGCLVGCEGNHVYFEVVTPENINFLRDLHKND